MVYEVKKSKQRMTKKERDIFSSVLMSHVFYYVIFSEASLSFLAVTDQKDDYLKIFCISQGLQFSTDGFTASWGRGNIVTRCVTMRDKQTLLFCTIFPECEES